MLDRATERARELGFRVLTATGVPSEAQIAFVAARSAATALSRFPGTPPGPATQRFGDGAWAPRRESPDLFLIALAALGVLSEVASDHPVVVVVEDAHWVDQPTCEVLAFVARRLDMEPIVLLLAMRDGFGGDLDAAQLPALRLGPLAEPLAADLLDLTAPTLPTKLRSRCSKSQPATRWR